MDNLVKNSLLFIWIVVNLDLLLLQISNSANHKNFAKMKKYTNEQTDILTNFLKSKKEAIASHHQGSSISEILGEKVIDNLHSLGATISSISINYYSCEGNAGTMNVCAIKVDDGNSFFGDYEKIAGFKFKIGSYSTGGHLQKYASLGRADVEPTPDMPTLDHLVEIMKNVKASFIPKTEAELNIMDSKQRRGYLSTSLKRENGISVEVKQSLNLSWSDIDSIIAGSECAWIEDRNRVNILKEALKLI